MSFSRAFLAGMQAREARDRRKEEEEKKAALAEISAAKAEESVGYTADDGAALEAAAKSGQYIIGTKTNEDGTFAGYTVTPKADPTQTGTIAMQGVTDFMGKRTAGTMSEDQVDRARQIAMAGVITKYDPQEGMRMRREVRAQERDDQRWDRQTKQWEREDKKLAEEDEYQRGYKDLYANTRYSQNQARHQQEMAKYQQNLAQYEADKAAGKQVGAAPVMPSAPEYSVGDRLADRATLLDYKARAGKVDPREFGEFTDLLDKVQGEGYERAMRLAQSGAPIQEVAKAFNATGQTKFDPASVVSDKVVKGKDGVETRVIQYKDAQGNVRTINTVAELDALGKASDVYTRFYQGETNRRGNEQLQLSKNADARAGAQASQANADRTEAQKEKQAKADAAVAIFKERNPNATEAELNAVRRGILEPVQADGITSDFKTDPLGGGYVTQKDKQGNVVITPVDRKGTQGQPVRVAPPGQTAAPTKPKSEPEAHAQAKAAVAKGADRDMVNKRLREMGFKPLTDW